MLGTLSACAFKLALVTREGCPPPLLLWHTLFRPLFPKDDFPHAIASHSSASTSLNASRLTLRSGNNGEPTPPTQFQNSEPLFQNSEPLGFADVLDRIIEGRLQNGQGESVELLREALAKKAGELGYESPVSHQANQPALPAGKQAAKPSRLANWGKRLVHSLLTLVTIPLLNLGASMGEGLSDAGRNSNCRLSAPIDQIAACVADVKKTPSKWFRISLPEFRR